jgi:hypothetical protein
VAAHVAAPTTVELLPSGYLERWQRQGGISVRHIDNAEYWARNASKWEVAGSWRARIADGSLWVKMLSMQSHWGERTSVLRLLLMALRRGGARVAKSLEGLDIVYVHNDRDPTPWRGYPRGSGGTYIPLLTNAHDSGKSSLPVPEFSWVGWHTHTPPWCTLMASISDAGARIPWANRTDIGIFSGGLESGPVRHALRRVSGTAAAQGVIKVRNVAPRFFTTTAAASSGRDPPTPMSSLCGYKYLLSVTGYGYSNRLKSLLLCGSVVVHVKQPWNEFFFPMLKDGVHLVVAKTVDDIIPTIKRLRANDSLAQRIGAAGRRLALAQMSMDRVLDYFLELLTSYTSIQRERGSATAGFTRIATHADLGRIAAQCDCGKGVTKPTAELCGVSPTVFAHGPLRGKHRCCDGWDCPVDVCAEATVPSRRTERAALRAGRQHTSVHSERMPASKQGGGAAAAAADTKDAKEATEVKNSLTLMKKARKSAEAAGGVFIERAAWDQMQRKMDSLEQRVQALGSTSARILSARGDPALLWS